MINLPDIKSQLNRKELFDAFKIQLAKDFEQSNFPFDFVQILEPSYDALHKKIAQELERNERRTGFSIMSLLYRIDISEAQLKKYVTENANVNHFSLLAELIIKRVLQKVITKYFYKANNNQEEYSAS